MQQQWDIDGALSDILQQFPDVVLGAEVDAVTGMMLLPYLRLQAKEMKLGALLPATERYPLVFTPNSVDYSDMNWQPSLALQALAGLLGVEKAAIKVQSSAIRVGQIILPTSPDGTILPRVFSGWPSFSAQALLTHQVAIESLRDQVVLIAPPQTLLIQAPAFAALLTPGHYALEPQWQVWGKILAMLVALAWVNWGMSPVKATMILLNGFIGLSAGFAMQSALLVYAGWWVPVSGALLLIACAIPLLLLRVLWLTIGQHIYRNTQQAEQWRLQGLACQGRGELAQAFEHFSRCVPDALGMSLMYNLALDFERSRQPRQAATIYRYLAQLDANFRDISLRLHALEKPHKHRFSTTMQERLDDISAHHKPTVGRYQIERKLAQGAMGVVYLGKDPKLDRMVAIKTLALAQEFEGQELQEATTRFFREAGAAGRLSHPYIIQVYDAGEEYDVAYISMEFFKGSDLTPYIQQDHLLPLEIVLDLMIKASEALDYAHRQGVIHRDIKPANILYNPVSGMIKLTDFGIARVMDSHHTRTGVVLGTPSYMSPEQLAGKPLDGRTDLFSLGITCYQLLSGKLPFTAESMASLMFKIATESPTDLSAHCPNLPACVKQVVDILLHKNPNSRYPSGAATAIALRNCQALFKTGDPNFEGKP